MQVLGGNGEQPESSTRAAAERPFEVTKSAVGKKLPFGNQYRLAAAQLGKPANPNVPIRRRPTSAAGHCLSYQW
jgi:hypothetical protein